MNGVVGDISIKLNERSVEVKVTPYPRYWACLQKGPWREVHLLSLSLPGQALSPLLSVRVHARPLSAGNESIQVGLAVFPPADQLLVGLA